MTTAGTLASTVRELKWRLEATPLTYRHGSRAMREDGEKCAESSLPIVSVVMPAYNCDWYIERAMRSVLQQELHELELIVVDDASTDRTIEIAQTIASTDPRVRILASHLNRGPYWCKNLGILHAFARFVALHDADDISHPERLTEQIRALRSHPRVVACYVNGMRRDSSGAVVPQRGRTERLAFASLLFDREAVLPHMGFFDSIRYAADDEFHRRLLLTFGKERVIHHRRVLYEMSARPDSLSSAQPVALEVRRQLDGELWFLSPSRRAYVHAYRSWHDRTAHPFMPFPPPASRFFPIPDDMRSPLSTMPPVTASLASHPPRRQSLEMVVDAVAPQVDSLYVYLNEYKDIPRFLQRSNVVTRSSAQFGVLRDNGKFFFAEGLSGGVHFTLDDDIHYPPMYVRYLVAKLQQYAARSVVGVHGTRITPHFRRYHDPESRETVRFSRALGHDWQVHVLGTGTAAYYVKTFNPSLSCFGSTGMADIWFAREAQQQNVPMICVARPGQFLRDIEDTQDHSLYVEFADRDGPQTRLVREIAPWRLPAFRAPIEPE